MIIRPMRPEDIPGGLAVAAEGWDRRTAQAAQPDFSDAFSSSAWRPFFYVAEVDGMVVGTSCYIVSWLCYGIYNLAWVAVKKDFRGRGIGAALVDRCLDDLRPIADAVMLATNVPDFYRRCTKDISSLDYRFRKRRNPTTTNPIQNVALRMYVISGLRAVRLETAKP